MKKGEKMSLEMREHLSKVKTKPRNLCKVCGEPVKRHKGDGSTYCSHSCYHQDRKGKPLIARRRTYIKKCEHCKKEFSVGGRFGKKMSAKYCSKNCANLALSKPIDNYFLGKGSKKSAIWRRLRREILEKYDNKCVLCGRNIKLQIHHIIPRDNGGKHNTNNLIPVCVKCHSSIEWITHNLVEDNLNNFVNIIQSFTK